MKTIVQTYQEKFSKIQSRNTRFFICMLALSIVVVIFVFYNLRSMGIAQVNDIPENIADVADISDSVEIASIWEETLPDAEELDGETYAEDVVLIAQSQLGYEESTTNFALADDGSHYGYTRYGEWLGNPYLEKWDAAFVSFCLYYAGVSEEDFPYNSGTFAWAAQLDEEEYFLSAEDHTPEIGDLIFFDTIGDETPDTMGIVTEILDEDETESGEPEIIVIQGDYDDTVAEVSYFTASPTIVGYAALPDKPDEDALLVATPITSTEAIESYSVSMETETAETEDKVDDAADDADVQIVTYDAEIEPLADTTEKYTTSDYPTTIPDSWARQGYSVYSCTQLDSSTSVTTTYADYGFWIWLKDSLNNTIWGSVDWTTAFQINTPVYDVLTDIYGSYYIPLSYLTDTNDKISITDEEIALGFCPFVYAPDPNSATYDNAKQNTTSYEILKDGGNSYVYVKIDSLSLGTLAPARVNIYYTGETFEISTISGRDTSLFLWAYVTDNNWVPTTLSDTSGKIGGYSTWYNDNSDIADGIGNNTYSTQYPSYTYTFGDEYCYLIPVEYFCMLYDQSGDYSTDATAKSAEAGVTWTYDPDQPCPFYYDPLTGNHTDSLSSEYGTEKAEYVFYDKNEDGEDECYVLLKTTTFYSGDSHPRFYVFYYTDYPDHDDIVVLNLGNNNGYVPLTVVGNNLVGNYNLDYYDYAYWGQNRTWSGVWGNEKETENEGRIAYGPLSDYVDSDGSVTIHLPCDDDLLPRKSLAGYEGDAFTVISGNNADLPDITTVFQETYNYDWKLIGWTNVATGEYYDVSDGATTATIQLYDESGDPVYNVFYADWIADSYDNGSSEDVSSDSVLGGLDEAVVDTSSFVSIKMFDYSETLNLYSLALNQDLTGETWADNLTFNADFFTDNTLKITNGDGLGSFLFVNNASYLDSDMSYSIGYPANKRPGNTYVGENYRGVTSNLGITTTNGTGTGILSVLFNTDNETNAHGVYYVGNANYLFELDDDNTYTFDSRTHAAVYNQSDERFYVYNNALYGYTYQTNGLFLPYNDPSWDWNTNNTADYGKPYQKKEMIDIHNGSSNYWFGMQIDVDFYNYGTNSHNNGNDITFNFYGDDDVWIFIDDILVVDLSGNHDSEYAILNFSQGSYQTGMTANLESLDKPETDTKDTMQTGSIPSDILVEGKHHLTLYYIERGAWESNLHLEFNLIPDWKYATSSATAISIRKDWLDAAGNPITEVDDLDLTATVGLFAKVAGATDAMNSENKYYVTYDESTQTYTYVNASDSDPENTKSYTIDEEGLAYDDNGNIVAYYAINAPTYTKEVTDENEKTISYIEEGALYIYVSEVELNSENSWNDSWRALLSGPDYILLELEHNWNYYATNLELGEFSDVNEDELYQYWHVVGEAEIESIIWSEEDPTWDEEDPDSRPELKTNSKKIEYAIYYSDDTTIYYYEPVPILITDAGYNEISGEIGVQAEVLTNQTSNGQTESQLTTKFLNISARPEIIDNVQYFGLIDDRDVTSDVIWYLQGVSDTTTDDTTGATVNMFYIFCYGVDEEGNVDKTNRYYLNAMHKAGDTAPSTLTVSTVETATDTKGNSSPDPYKSVLEFYYSNLGELFTTIGGGGEEGQSNVDDNSESNNYKVIFDQDGSVELTNDNIAKLDPQNARIYMLTTSDQINMTGYAYVLSNTESVGELPEAGGSGITLYLILGGGVIVVAAVLLVRRRRTA